MEDLWLIADAPEGITARDISEELDAHPIIGEKTKIVIRVPDSKESSYWGRDHRMVGNGWLDSGGALGRNFGRRFLISRMNRHEYLSILYDIYCMML
jgi:hypothetical protein